MQKQISVVLDKGVEFTFHVPEGPVLAHDAARAWLDKQFIELECEPLRADRKSTRLNSSHPSLSRMPSSA